VTYWLDRIGAFTAYHPADPEHKFTGGHHTAPVEELTAEEIRHLIEANAAKQGVVAFAEALRLSTRWVPE
jgi:hypothetical protein